MMHPPQKEQTAIYCNLTHLVKSWTRVRTGVSSVMADIIITESPAAQNTAAAEAAGPTAGPVAGSAGYSLNPNYSAEPKRVNTVARECRAFFNGWTLECLICCLPQRCFNFLFIDIPCSVICFGCTRESHDAREWCDGLCTPCQPCFASMCCCCCKCCRFHELGLCQPRKRTPSGVDDHCCCYGYE
eukprot:m.13854 g.13854  ORF g.13854 m.13854 type:complete len:186 (-) comp2875_c0_seq1:42-599(-)